MRVCHGHGGASAERHSAVVIMNLVVNEERRRISPGSGPPGITRSSQCVPSQFRPSADALIMDG